MMPDAQSQNSNQPWNRSVCGQEVLPLINRNARVIRVEAPPGAGKTFGLCRRVIRILHPEGLGCRGTDVAVMAFNRVIAKDLTQSISKQLEDSGIVENPRVQTIHGLCRGLLGDDGRRLLLPHERDILVVDLLHLHPILKERYGTSSRASQALRSHEAGHEEHVALWQAARQWLDNHRARLVGDLPSEVSDRLYAGDFLATRFRHVIVDEFQDLTKVEQNLVVAMLAADGQFVALGDARQSIYTFRGSERHGLDQLEELTGESVINIRMPTCKRCPSKIVDAANRLMALENSNRILSSSTTQANIHVVTHKTLQAEATAMASAILTNVRANPTGRHLVIVTRRHFGYSLRSQLLALDDSLQLDLSFSESILELWPVREAFLFFSLLVAPDPAAWRAWLAYRVPFDGRSPRGPHCNAGAYCGFMNDVHSIGVESIGQLVSEERAKRRGCGGLNLWDRAARFNGLHRSRDWTSLEGDVLIEEVFALDNWIGGDDPRVEETRPDLDHLKMQAKMTLDELRQGGTGDQQVPDQLMKRVVEDLRYRISVREPFVSIGDADLQITTLWGAKGLTADHVYVLGLCDEALPGRPSKEYPGSDADYLSEQRRLFYVAITRTKRTLVLSRPQKVLKGAARRLNLDAAGSNYYLNLSVSRFLCDILPVLPHAVTGDEWQGC